MKFESFCLTHSGYKREINEDSFCSNDNSGLWIVSDGMGGHSDGSFVSNLITSTFEKIKFSFNFNENCELISKTIKQIKIRLDEKTRVSQKKETIGATLMLLHIVNDEAVVFYSGDSRCYNIRDNKLSLVVVDHSRDMIVKNETKKVLTKAIFSPGELLFETKKFKVKKNDIFLLCSDGLYDNLNNSEIKSAMQTRSFKKGMKTLFNNVLSGEADDNLTGILIGSK